MVLCASKAEEGEEDSAGVKMVCPILKVVFMLSVSIYEEKKIEPDIWKSIKFGSVLESVVYDEHTCEVDYSDKAVTENTQTSYPIEFIPNANIPCVGPHPKNVILLGF